MQNRTTIQVSENLRQELRRLASRQDLSYEQLLWVMVDLFRELQPGRSLISIPSELATRLSRIQGATDCGTVSEYVTFLLRLFLCETMAESANINEISEQVREKLKRLGYL